MAAVPNIAEPDLAWLSDAGLTPGIFERLVELHEFLWSNSFDPRLMELIRIRIAQVLRAEDETARRSPAAVRAGLDEATIAELSRWPTAEAFDTRDRAALGWAEQWVLDVKGISDDDAARLQELFGADELAQLTMATALFEVITRTRVALQAT